MVGPGYVGRILREALEAAHRRALAKREAKAEARARFGSRAPQAYCRPRRTLSTIVIRSATPRPPSSVHSTTTKSPASRSTSETGTSA